MASKARNHNRSNRRSGVASSRNDVDSLDSCDLRDEKVLIGRLAYLLDTGHEKLSFLLGPSLATPWPHSHPGGIPTSDETVEMIRTFLGEDDHARARLDRELLNLSGQARLAKALEELVGLRSHQAADEILRRTVLRACECPADVLKWIKSTRDLDTQEKILSSLATNSTIWHLPPGIRALGTIATLKPDRFRAILTTSFDPLIQIAISAAGGKFRLCILSPSGDTRIKPADEPQLIHMRGFWLGPVSPTAMILRKAPRRELGRTVRQTIKRSTLIVMGYEDEVDIVELIYQSSRDPRYRSNIIWTIAEEDPRAAASKHTNLFRRFRIALREKRMHVYYGVSAHRTLSEVERLLRMRTSQHEQQLITNLDATGDQQNQISCSGDILLESLEKESTSWIPESTLPAHDLANSRQAIVKAPPIHIVDIANRTHWNTSIRLAHSSEWGHHISNSSSFNPEELSFYRFNSATISPQRNEPTIEKSTHVVDHKLSTLPFGFHDHKEISFYRSSTTKHSHSNGIFMPAVRPDMFSNEDALIHRLKFEHHCKRGVVFLVGSGLSLPHVPGVDGIIDILIELLNDYPAAQSDFKRNIRNLSGNAYESAFQAFLNIRGPSKANEAIRRAVLMARVPGYDTTNRFTSLIDGSASEADYTNISREPVGWQIPSGARALGELGARGRGHFAHTILTTNFDPLIELSIREANGRFSRTRILTDGSIDQTEADDDEVVRVIHLHGFWHGETMHTPAQLRAPRPRLGASLRRLISNNVLVVMAYGGWNDIITEFLASTFHSDDCNADVLWTFYDSDKYKLTYEQTGLFERFEDAFKRGRMNLYSGVDVNSFLPRLSRELSSGSSLRSSKERLVVESIARAAAAAVTQRASRNDIVSGLKGDSTLIAELDTVLMNLRTAGLVHSHPDGSWSPTSLGLKSII
ncbi:SIR2 family protein [Sorangium sp. So ce1153]|uniref:SIR2 family protein n=1 Tax=Sorangium sp. So ce1153 TaxID=3133333 RepID=UPI003F6333FE